MKKNYWLEYVGEKDVNDFMEDQSGHSYPWTPNEVENAVSYYVINILNLEEGTDLEVINELVNHIEMEIEDAICIED